VIAAIAILLCAVSIWYFARHSAGPQETSGNNITASSQPAGPLSTQSDAKGKRAAQAASAGAASELGAIVGKEVKAAKPVSQPAGASKAQPPASKPMQVSSQEMRSKLVYHPAPQYPQAAKAAHIQGMVRLYALIDRDGTVKGLKVISGHPLLVKAAMAGIEQWRYKPTLRNGQPVEVETEIDVNFTLEGEKNGIAGFESSNSGNQQTAKAQPTGPVNPPVPIYQPAAPYTDQARMNKIQGIVKLVVSTDAQGNVIGTKVITPLESSLDESAADTVRTWKFKPATQNGVPVPVTIAVNVDFKLY
jgi:TonB family protein